MALILLFLIFNSAMTFAAETSSTSLPPGQSRITSQESSIPPWTENIGMSYFTFFDGPGLAPGMNNITPNVLGKPLDDGLRLNNFISFKYKFTSTLSFDLQMRTQWILNNANEVDHFNTFRWQSPRVGVSGKLMAGEDWALNGALNTDFPYFLPSPIGGGFIAQQRTTIFDPGLFANFSYTPKKSHWSVFSLVMPRYFFYADRNVAEPQLSRAGFSPTLKNEFIFDVAPSINYALTRTTGLRFGTEIIYSKLILSSWNPLNASLNNSNLENDAWRIAPVPFQLGLTHEFNPAFNVSTFIQAFPVAAQRVRRDGSQATFFETASIGMWINGRII